MKAIEGRPGEAVRNRPPRRRMRRTSRWRDQLGDCRDPGGAHV